MTNSEELNIDELEAVVGGCHGTGKCPSGSGQGDGLGQLRAAEGGLIAAGQALVSTILGIL
jgi:bacteriocin-like protein